MSIPEVGSPNWRKEKIRDTAYFFLGRKVGALDDPDVLEALRLARLFEAELDAPERPNAAPLPWGNLEALSSRLHDIYQLEIRRCGDARHADAYEDHLRKMGVLP